MAQDGHILGELGRDSFDLERALPLPAVTWTNLTKRVEFLETVYLDSEVFWRWQRRLLELMRSGKHS
jgi:hypothetical protein